MKFKTYISTGKAAKLLHCSQQTIIRAYEKGVLRGHLTPASNFRKILTEDVLAFAKKNKIVLPCDEELYSLGVLEQE